jgi:enterobactin synthetase component D
MYPPPCNPSSHFQELLPPGAVACAVALRPGDVDAVESRFSGIPIPGNLADAVPRRKLHYAAGRYCARIALAQLGVTPDNALSRDADNSPIWPAGVIGSISHTDDLAWAAVARADGMVGLGVDVEQLLAAPRAARLEHLVCRPGELDLAAASGLTRSDFLTLAFSFKESVFKCAFPLVRKFFGYRDATILGVDATDRSIVAQLETTLSDTLTAGTTFAGRFALTEMHVFTSVCLPAAIRQSVSGGRVQSPGLSDSLPHRSSPFAPAEARLDGRFR